MMKLMLPAKMDYVIMVVLLMCMGSCALGATTIFNVMNYGAVGNGRTDDSQAFLKAWKAACQAQSTTPVVLVPQKQTFLLNPLTFNGPCKSSRIYMLVSGKIIAPVKAAWSGKQRHAWIIFSYVNGLIVKGKGVIDGQGPSWWPAKPCFNDPANGVNCKGPTLNKGTNQKFFHSNSIGSLGGGGFDVVENVRVRNCTLKGTLTGVRIKTNQGGKGYARKISFEGIKLEAVDNPIQIEQFYCPLKVNCQNYTSAVSISDVSFTGISGTSIASNVINLSCSQTVGCTNIKLDRVYITSSTPGNKVFANCFNAHGKATRTKPAVKCLLP
ncbi:hypothetical protein DH2020_041081 [Rehmannia glutinosa]|uniref:Polygalacturonase n=1 Tax=Rehmannia glutinosa TaxID=99300 RepID=A0ABR0UR79_REHGL